MIAVSDAFISLWCVRDSYVKCVWFKTNNDDGHSCIDITVLCTSNAYDSKRNNDNGHS